MSNKLIIKWTNSIISFFIEFVATNPAISFEFANWIVQNYTNLRLDDCLRNVMLAISVKSKICTTKKPQIQVHKVFFLNFFCLFWYINNFFQATRSLFRLSKYINWMTISKKNRKYVYCVNPFTKHKYGTYMKYCEHELANLKR